MLSHQFLNVYELTYNFYFDYNTEAIATFTKYLPNKASITDIFKSIYFKWTSKNQAPECDFRDLKIKKDCDFFNGTSLIEAIIANGGLKSLLPVFTKETLGPSKLFRLFDCIFVMKSLDNLVSEEFFEALNFVLEESIPIPTRAHLDAITNIIDKIEWNMEYQFRIIKDILLNFSIWNNLSKDILDIYLKALLKYIPPHFNNKENNITFVYAYLTSFEDYFAHIALILDIIEKTLLLTETDCRLESIISIFMMILDSDDFEHITSTFLEILYTKKIVVSLTDNLCFLLLYLIEKQLGLNIQAKCLKLIFSNNFSLCTITYEEAYESVYCRIRNEIDYETSLALIEIFSNQNSKDLGCLIDLITTGIAESHDMQKIINLLLSESNNMRIKHIIHERSDFPQWVIRCINNNPLENICNLVVNIFCNKTYVKNFNKLREFSKLFSATSLAPMLFNMFFVILEYYRSSQTFVERPEILVDFVGSFEDSLPFFEDHVPSDIFADIVTKIYQICIENNTLTCTYPYLPRISFGFLVGYFSQISEDQNLNLQNSYIKEGGIIRALLKLALTGLVYEENKACLSVIENIILREYKFTKEWEKKLSGCKRYTETVKDFPKEFDEFSTRYFIVLWIISEYTEIIYHKISNSKSTNLMIPALRKIITKTRAYNMIEETINFINNEGILSYYELIKNRPEIFISASFYGQKQMFEEHLKSELELIKSKETFQFHDLSLQLNLVRQIRDQAGFLQLASNSDESLFRLLISETWIRKTHFFLLGYTSLKLNLITICREKCRYPSKEPPIVAREGLAYRIWDFILKKRDEISNFKISMFNNINTKLKNGEIKYQKYLKQTKKNISTVKSESHEGIKLHPIIDKIGRTPFTRPAKKMRSSLVKQSTVSPLFELSNRDAARSLSILLRGDSSFEYRNSPSCSPRGTDISQLTPFDELCIEEEDNEAEDPSPMSLLSTPLSKDPFKQGTNFDTFDCELIKIRGSYFGTIEISALYLLYISEGKLKPQLEMYEGSAPNCSEDIKERKIIWEPREIREIYGRRFMHRYTAFEIFLKTGGSYYINLFNPDHLSSALKIIKL